MGKDVETTFSEMLNEWNMTYEEYIKAVRTKLVRPKLFLQHKTCEIKINNHMKHCIELWRINHGIQPCRDKYPSL